MSGMSGIELFGILSGIASVVSLVFALWIWIHSKELQGVIRSIYSIANVAIWESQIAAGLGQEAQLRQADKALGCLTSISKLSEPHQRESSVSEVFNIRELIERGVLWSDSKLWDVENSPQITEVWVVTADLKPDSSQPLCGEFVLKNLKQGKRYVYFYPETLAHKDAEIRRLIQNIGLGDRANHEFTSQVSYIPLSDDVLPGIFASGNVVLYFRDSQRATLPRCFQEIIISQVSNRGIQNRDRGILWQEHNEDRTRAYWYPLQQIIGAANSSLAQLNPHIQTTTHPGPPRSPSSP